MSDEDKLYKLIEGNYRKPDEPIDIRGLIIIAEKLEKIESTEEKVTSKT